MSDLFSILALPDYLVDFRPREEEKKRVETSQIYAFVRNVNRYPRHSRRGGIFISFPPWTPPALSILDKGHNKLRPHARASNVPES